MTPKVTQAIFAALLLPFVISWGIGAEENFRQPSPDQTVQAASSLLVEADKAYALRGEPGEAKRALDLYEKAVLAQPDHYEALWKLTRAAWWVGTTLENKKEKITAYKKGIEYGEKAVALNPDAVEGHFWLGTINASYGEAKGVLKSLFLIGPIRKELDETVRIDPSFQSGGGHRILGILDYRVPRFAGGNRGRALKRLNMAYHVDPNNPYNLYYLAEYHHHVKKDEMALKYLEDLANAVVPEEKKPDLKLMQKKGEALRSKLKL